MKKRILALVLSAAMVMGMGLTAFAADTVVTEKSAAYTAEVSGTSSTKVPTIKITVPSNLGNIIINPYQMEVSVSDGDAKEKAQIISVPATITNESDVAVRVDVTELTTTIDSNSKVVLATAAYKNEEAQAKDTKKSVFAWVEFIEGTDASKFASEYAKTNTNMIVLSKKGSLNNAIVLGAGNTTASFKISGQVATEPAEQWTENDKFTVTMKFTFVPQVNSTN